MALLSSIGVESVKIETQPNGINMFLNDEPLPGIAYDTASLDQLMTLVNAFVTDPATQDMIAQVVPLLPGADITVARLLYGRACRRTRISARSHWSRTKTALCPWIRAYRCRALRLPPDVVSQLQAANVQQVDVNLLEDRLGIATNGQALPTISAARRSA